MPESDSYNVPFAKLESDLLQNVNAQSQLAQQANTLSEYYYELASALELVTALCLTGSVKLSNLIFGWPGDGRYYSHRALKLAELRQSGGAESCVLQVGPMVALDFRPSG